MGPPARAESVRSPSACPRTVLTRSRQPSLALATADLRLPMPPMSWVGSVRLAEAPTNLGTRYPLQTETTLSAARSLDSPSSGPWRKTSWDRNNGMWISIREHFGRRRFLRSKSGALRPEQQIGFSLPVKPAPAIRLRAGPPPSPWPP
jgi:hypothetical protein